METTRLNVPKARDGEGYSVSLYGTLFHSLEVKSSFGFIVVVLLSIYVNKYT